MFGTQKCMTLNTSLQNLGFKVEPSKNRNGWKLYKSVLSYPADVDRILTIFFMFHTQNNKMKLFSTRAQNSNALKFNFIYATLTFALNTNY